MRRVWLCVCILMMCAACETLGTNKPDPQPPPPIKREVRYETIRCEVPEVPVPEPARAANCADSTAEEQALTAAFTQAAKRIESLWGCIYRHNERARKKSK